MNYKIIGKGEPLVLLHGLGQTFRSWRLQEELSEHYRLVLPTLRGHGDSSLTEDISLDTFADDVLYLMDCYKIEKAHIGGLSLGGVVAQAIYAKAPERVKSLILANTTSYVPSFLGELSVLERVCTLNSSTTEEYIREIARASLYNPDEALLQEAMEGFSINRGTYPIAARAVKGANFLPVLAQADVPIQIISSTHDVVTPYMFNGLYMHIWARTARNAILNNTGHLSSVQKPEQFNKIVLDFLKDIEGVN